jgi:diguanylate cyclase (GGDEF)-like protein/PAS domain S-box-containing protein
VNDIAPVAAWLAPHYQRLLDAAPIGVVLVDSQAPDGKIVYASPGIAAMSGYSQEEVLGRELLFLRGEDRDREARERLLEQVRRGEPGQALLRSYRKDGTAFWNELTIVPLRDEAGVLIHVAAYFRDAAERLRPESAAREGEARPAPSVNRDDRLTGLFSLPFLEELLKRDWAIAQRENRSIAVFAIDVDALDLYNSTFGRAAGDSAIRRVAHCVSGCLRRASDVTARVDGGALLAYAPGLDTEQALRIGTTMAQRVRDLRIHHPRSTVLRYVSISVGVAAMSPEAADIPADLLQKARQQLDLAKKSGRNHAA